MADAAQKVGDGKSSWQRLMSGVVDTVRPMAARFAPVVMPMLDRPAMRRVEQAVNIEDLRVAAEKRAHAMVYGYLAGGADDERALRRSVAAYNDVELRHAVLHGIGHGDMDLRTKILGVETKLPFFVTSRASSMKRRLGGTTLAATCGGAALRTPGQRLCRAGAGAGTRWQHTVLPSACAYPKPPSPPPLSMQVRRAADVPCRRRGRHGQGGQEARLLHGPLAAHDLHLRGRALRLSLNPTLTRR